MNTNSTGQAKHPGWSTSWPIPDNIYTYSWSNILMKQAITNLLLVSLLKLNSRNITNFLTLNFLEIHASHVFSNFHPFVLCSIFFLQILHESQKYANTKFWFMNTFSLTHKMLNHLLISLLSSFSVSRSNIPSYVGRNITFNDRFHWDQQKKYVPFKLFWMWLLVTACPMSIVWYYKFYVRIFT